MADIIRIKRRVSGSPGAPTSLANAELAYNEADHILYYGEGTGGAGGTATVVSAIAGQGLASTVAPQMDGTAAVGTATQWARGDHKHPSDTTRAPLASPVFTGTPQSTTTTPATDTSVNIATDAFVWSAIHAASISALLAPTADVAWGNYKITGVANPVNAQDAATKNYVDATVQGMTPKPTAWVATTAALPANTYNNGAAGVGATLTATANAALTIDGVAVAANQIVLVKNEAAGANNGLYVVTNPGSASAAYVMTRHADMDQAGEFSGGLVPVGNAGTTNTNTMWMANPSVPVTVGTTVIPFTQVNAATNYVAGNGINITGVTISAVGTANRVVVTGPGIDIAANYVGQSSITTLGTIATGVWQGTPIAQAYIAGLGTMASQNASAVAITGGTIDGVTIDGGTF